MTVKYHIKQIVPSMPQIWGTTEWFYWNQEVNEILGRDVDGILLKAAYDSDDRFYLTKWWKEANRKGF